MIHLVLPLVFLFIHIRASPVALPQAVTEAIAPPAPTPQGCWGSYPSVFGVAVVNISTASSGSLVRRQSDVHSSLISILTIAEVSQIGDGQIQGGMHTVTIAPVTQIADGQLENPVATPLFLPANARPRATPPLVTTSASSTDDVVEEEASGCHDPPRPRPAYGDTSGVSQSVSPSTTLTTMSSSTPITTTKSTISSTSSSPSSSSSSDASTSVLATPPALSLVSCLTNSTLHLTLSNNTLYDALNRTGYIASNYQFQFDGPPQSGAIYTSGWSVCPVVAGGDSTGSGSGSWTLALGARTTFWQCLSGEFYNLYTENWAAQCSAVEIRIVELIVC